MFSLTWLTIAASVVDLPGPVGPVHRMSPRGRIVSSANTLGAFNSSSESTFDGMVRNAAAAPRCWLKALTRKRARFGTANEKSVSRFSSYDFRCASLMMSYTMECTSSCSIGGRLIRRMSPWTRMTGGIPADRCRSEALFLTAKASSSVMSIYNPRRISIHGTRNSVAPGRNLPSGAFVSTSTHYVPLREGVARRTDARRGCGPCRWPRRGDDPRARGQQDLSAGGDPGAVWTRTARFRRELRPGGARQGGRARGSRRPGVAPDRSPAEQQVAGGRGVLRVGRNRGSPEDRRAARGGEAAVAATARRVRADQHQRRAVEERRGTGRGAGVGPGRRRAAPPAPARLHGHRGADGGSG